ncbi:hypothetical protein [Brevifollis gellanilyticus]|uniref:Uncharacterized protein n=1 Tax=Brevifollis gellanilyticus TaxID=748831 RepID=A0A512M287_9BACT|nr:hypothetical protein [Brevifollis gellanilyticus]GEP40852.1 hypothetical protein BGE01nite_01430 [Brevifollis gellanilyticus]
MSSITLLLAAEAAAVVAEKAVPPFSQTAALCFAFSGLCLLISAGLKLFAEHRHALGSVIAAAGLVLALISFSFAWQVRHVDFQPTVGAAESTGSPSLLKSLFVPFVPVLLNAALLFAHRRRASRGPSPEA